MNINLTENEINFLKKLNEKMLLQVDKNLANASPIYIVYVESEKKLEDNFTSNGIIVKYKINDVLYESFEDIKCVLKYNLFENIFKKEKNVEHRENFFLDSKCELFTTCTNRNSCFNEIKNEIKQLFSKVDNNVFELESLKNFVFEYNDDKLLSLADFPLDDEKYSSEYFETIYVPYAMFTKKTEANKLVRSFEKKNCSAYVESYSTINKKSDMTVLRNILLKLTSNIDNCD